MSRVRVTEVSSPISLFPFIGILLCTMAALLVILIAVSRSARDTAVKQVEAQQPTAAKPTDEARQKLAQLNTYVGKLKQVEGDAQRKLREDQLRLSHIEDHIRRMQEQFRSVQMAAIELAALEEEHYDDRQQAEREVQRLRHLIAQSEKAIAGLKEQTGKGKRSYAVMPYEGPNGTFRRPIYVECVEKAVILQPEGVEISEEMLRPPYGPGNPLAAALRAAREHLIRLYPNEGQSRDTEPYPLLLVRPDGLFMYNRARKSIEDGDFDFGYELVEAEWKLKYPTPDPALAVIEQQAIEQACVRQEVLAAAAPRAYRHPALAAAGQFEFADEAEGHGGGRSGAYVVIPNRVVGGNSLGESASDSELGSDNSGSGDAGGARGGEGGNGSGGMTGGADGDVHGASNNGQRSNAEAGSGQGDSAVGASEGNSSGGAIGRPAIGGQHAASVVSNSPEGGVGLAPDESGQPPTAVSAMTGSPPSTTNDPHRDQKKFQPRGRDWALDRKPSRAVPVQRTIHVIVREDQIAIMPEIGRTDENASVDDIVPMKGDTVEVLDAFVAQVRKRIEDWGIAGDGLYWRPVLILTIGPNGERRASDLSRLLKNSGLEIHAHETARNTTQGEDNETR